MSGEPSTPSPVPRRGLLRRREQFVVAALTAAGLMWLSVKQWTADESPVENAPQLSYSFKIDINQAGWPEIAQLPGIGEVLARRIVQLREERGGFRTLAEIEEVHGIGPKKLAAMTPYLLPIEVDEEALDASLQLTGSEE